MPSSGTKRAAATIMCVNGAEPSIFRMRMIYDAPTPSTNATMITVLSRLGLITGEGIYGHRAQALIAVQFARRNQPQFHVLLRRDVERAGMFRQRLCRSSFW